MVYLLPTRPADPENPQLFKKLPRDLLRTIGEPLPRIAFGRGALPSAISRLRLPKTPAVDLTETDKGYEVTAELPGVDEKNIEVKLSNHTLTIKGEKSDEKEETKKDYYMREWSFAPPCFSAGHTVRTVMLRTNGSPETRGL